MFNFHGPPHNLLPTRSRISVSDTGLSAPGGVHVARRGPNSFSRTNDSGSGSGHAPISLPPLVKTKSLTVAGSQSQPFSINRSYRQQSLTNVHHGLPTRLPPEPKKLPSHRELLTLTLTHAKAPTARGLNFEQLSSFIRGAFEIPKTIAWESKLSKTLSNMVSKGVVINNPGLGPQDTTYQIAATDESGLNLSISGKSLPKVPSWPTGFALPTGANLLCRAGPKILSPEDELNSFIRNQAKNNPIQQRNRRNMRLDPMPYMPVADPMISESFGVRAGLVTKGTEKQCLNSPNNSEIDEDEDENDNEDDGANPPYYDPGDLWKPVMPLDSPHSQISNSSLTKQINPYMQTNRKIAPRILDTVTQAREKCDQEGIERDNKSLSDYLSSNADDDEDFNDYPNKKNDLDRKILTMHKTKAKSSSTNLELGITSEVQTLSSRSRQTNCSTQSQESFTKATSKFPLIRTCDYKVPVPLPTPEMFADYAGETRQEYEINSRSCSIMNDFANGKSRSRMSRAQQFQNQNTSVASPKSSGISIDIGGAGDSIASQIIEVGSAEKSTTENAFESRMDYLMGIADLIGNYEDEPPKLRKGGSRSRVNPIKLKK